MKQLMTRENTSESTFSPPLVMVEHILAAVGDGGDQRHDAEDHADDGEDPQGLDLGGVLRRAQREDALEQIDDAGCQRKNAEDDEDAHARLKIGVGGDVLRGGAAAGDSEAANRADDVQNGRDDVKDTQHLDDFLGLCKIHNKHSFFLAPPSVSLRRRELWTLLYCFRRICQDFTQI